jgi:hypothetical protein
LDYFLYFFVFFVSLFCINLGIFVFFVSLFWLFFVSLFCIFWSTFLTLYLNLDHNTEYITAEIMLYNSFLTKFSSNMSIICKTQPNLNKGGIFFPDFLCHFFDYFLYFFVFFVSLFCIFCITFCIFCVTFWIIFCVTFLIFWSIFLTLYLNSDHNTDHIMAEIMLYNSLLVKFTQSRQLYAKYDQI